MAVAPDNIDLGNPGNVDTDNDGSQSRSFEDNLLDSMEQSDGGDYSDNAGDTTAGTQSRDILDVTSGQQQQTQQVQQQQQQRPVQTQQTQQQSDQAFRDTQALTFRSDAQGNLVDANGNVIARSGKDRSVFERAANFFRSHIDGQQRNIAQITQNASSQIQQLQGQVQQLQGQVQAFEQSSNAATQLGLTGEEQLSGLKVMKAWKDNPVGTIKYLMGVAKGQGHDLTPLGQQSSQIDMAALKQMLTEGLQPLTTQQQKDQREQEIREQTARDIQNFYGRYHDAQVHDDSLGALVAKDPNLSLEGAYWMLREYATKHQLDFTKPLGPQRALQLQQQNSAGQVNGQQTTSQQTFNPGSVRGAGSGTALRTQEDVAMESSADARWDDIIHAAMRESNNA